MNRTRNSVISYCDHETLKIPPNDTPIISNVKGRTMTISETTLEDAYGSCRAIKRIQLEVPITSISPGALCRTQIHLFPRSSAVAYNHTQP
ncbi:hypothetical protein BS47DRAFT_1403488 [Hydnum rufescens UP504]|uniref:Uncharacterized protein n=1 Tax=Hydnum rufescens UP504 TaxID=1448309 RepID=A0A9P6ACD8_9AGAM|nr:hypothetical protein BS47DRAFT_1403488 [Hydnum rufescens UP504]